MSSNLPNDPYYGLLKTVEPPQDSPLGDKPSELENRKQEALRISQLLEKTNKFSFLRLGDMELAQLLAFQFKLSENTLAVHDSVNGTLPGGDPGIGIEFAPLLKGSYERADYVDFHQRLWPIGPLLPRLQLNCKPGQEKNPDSETSYILLTWLEFEFFNYCLRNSVGFAGAEAGLLQNLSMRGEFQQAAREFWPMDANYHFHQIRNDGKDVVSNLELIKNDLKQFVYETGVNTIFLSLGGAAKILCSELAEELNIRMFDAGSMLRSLTYSGSDGNRASRSTHFPFLFRIPFQVWCDAMEQTWPSLEPHEKLAKIHAQLILEVQKKEVGWTHGSGELDLSQKNRTLFRKYHEIYLKRYGPIFDASPKTRKERANFLHFCGTHRLTGEGRSFIIYFSIKDKLKNIAEHVPFWS